MAPISISSRSLLLLPPPPISTSYSDLQAAYGQPLLDALQAVANTSRDHGRTAILEIALPCPDLWQHRHLPRSHVFSGVQTLLAGVYKLISVICARESIETEGLGGVDARLLLISEPPDDDTAHENELGSFLCGPGVTMKTLVLSGRPWQRILSLNDERGELTLQRFRELSSKTSHTPSWSFEKVGKGHYAVESADHSGDSVHPSEHQDQKRRHFSVAAGGTFDHLHIGHKLLLTMTALVLEPLHRSENETRKVTVGISGDELLRNKKFAECLGPWGERATAVTEFIKAIADFHPPNQSAHKVTSSANDDPDNQEIVTQIDSSFCLRCVKIMDPYGPTITEESISALVVSAETRSGGRAINEKRKEKDWQELDIFEVDVLDAQDAEGGSDEKLEKDFASKISSTEIRRRISEKNRATRDA